jgi:hypothetical protein
MAKSLSIKVDGVWTTVKHPFVKRNGIWVQSDHVFIKDPVTHDWKEAFHFDKVPSNPPEMTLNLVEDWQNHELKSRWIRVGIRLPGALHDPEARLTRVLTTYAGKAPTTPLGGTYTEAPDSNFPNEPWSEWRYNNYGVHKDTSLYAYKQWPRNAQGNFTITPDKDFHFGAWSLDNDGNWSVGVQAMIHTPKPTVKANNIIYKDARFQPNSSGSWRKGTSAGSGSLSGNLLQQSNPQSQGLWFYGNQFTDSIGSHTTAGEERITVQKAQILIRRANDSGAANANVYLFWNEYPGSAALPGSNNSEIITKEVTKLGTLAKGQQKWFDLPESYYGDLNTKIKGLGLDCKDPVKATAFAQDYSEVVSTSANLRCGEVYVQWKEEL